ncbi:pyridoxal 5'-phosphate synthase glutaminase subunit PdxT [Halococcus sp. AFM35]|uniref:pyridoxal 5'-phosphate synthase glutaminase subunit PdxT n=1 Tax=Halococcus sp. AFM35 TaxID=3421653 RepID=UPI003EB8795A
MSLMAGVIAVQGDFREHAAAIERAARAHGERAEPVEIRSSGTIPDCDLLLLPGGESTAISNHLQREGMGEEIVTHVEAGKPLLATCAGLIVACRDAGDERVEHLNLVDATVERNAFGRQRDSFETRLDVTGLEERFPAVFIRAPCIDETGDCEVLATFDGQPVAVRDGPVLGTAFHPELTDDARIHGLAFFESADE